MQAGPFRSSLVSQVVSLAMLLNNSLVSREGFLPVDHGLVAPFELMAEAMKLFGRQVLTTRLLFQEKLTHYEIRNQRR